MKCTQKDIKRFNEHGTYLIDEQFLRENWEQIHLIEIFDKYHTVTTEFFREFRDKLDWRWISQNEILTEDQIEEFRDKINWTYIWCYYSHFSQKFIDKWKDTRI